MEFWFTELHTENVKLSIKVDKQIYSEDNDYNRIDIFESPEFGRFFTLDGYLMLTEKDEFIYHEMIVHVPMSVHPHVRKVLVIGGGDGGTVREVLRHDSVERVVLCEIDGTVVDVCKKYIPNGIYCSYRKSCKCRTKCRCTMLTHKSSGSRKYSFSRKRTSFPPDRN